MFNYLTAHAYRYESRATPGSCGPVVHFRMSMVKIMPIYVFAADVDHTVVLPDRYDTIATAQEGIDMLREAEIRPSFCTGQSVQHCTALLRHLCVDLPCGFEHGAIILHPDGRKEFLHDVYPSLGVDGSFDALRNWGDAVRERYEELRQRAGEIGVDDIRILDDKETMVSLLFDPAPGRSGAIYRLMHDYFMDAAMQGRIRERRVFTRRPPYAVDFTLPVGKGHFLDHILHRVVPCNPSYAAVAGDSSHTDIEMFDRVYPHGHAFCPADADDATTAYVRSFRSGYVSPRTCGEGAFVDICRRAAAISASGRKV